MALMTLVGWLLAAPLAFGGPVADLVLPLGDAEVNWTKMVVRGTQASSPQGAASSRKAVEQNAMNLLDERLRGAAAAVALGDGRTVGSLAEDPALGPAVSTRLGRWDIASARYLASGRVEIVGEVALAEVLKPWTLQTATTPPVLERQPRLTGLVVDARGTGATPAFAPRVVGHDGVVLYEGRVWKEWALEAVPVIYVGDPAHPAATRAGAEPLIVVAAGASGSDLVLSQEETQRFRTSMVDAKVLGIGTVVIVLDGPK